MTRTIQLIVVCISMFFAVTEQLPADVIFGSASLNNERYVHQITNVEIAGVLYDITFHDGSFNDVYGVPDTTFVTPTPFNSWAASREAEVTITNYLNQAFPTPDGIYGFTGNQIPEMAGSSIVRIPHHQAVINGNILDGSYGYFFTSQESLVNYPHPIFRDHLPWISTLSDPKIHFATFKVVPEPSVLAYCGLGCLVLGRVRFKRKVA